MGQGGCGGLCFVFHVVFSPILFCDISLGSSQKPNTHNPSFSVPTAAMLNPSLLSSFCLLDPVSLPPLSSASSNNLLVPPPPSVARSHPLPFSTSSLCPSLTLPLSHLLTFSHFPYQASHTLQVMENNIHLFLPSSHPSKSPLLCLSALCSHHFIPPPAHIL